MVRLYAAAMAHNLAAVDKREYPFPDWHIIAHVTTYSPPLTFAHIYAKVNV